MTKPPEPPEPLIHRAARLGDLAELDRLLRTGADVNERADLEVDNGPRLRGLTPLMTAARSVDGAGVETLRFLLERGAELHAQSEGENTAAWYAAGMGGRWEFHPWRLLPDHVERLRFLLDLGLDPHEEDFVHRSLLVEACEAGDPARVSLLLDRGAPHTPALAIEQDRRARAGEGPSRHERLQEMLASGVTPDEMLESLGGLCEDDGALSHYQIPLHCAAQSGSAECIRLLLDAGALPDLRDDGRRTPLMFAGSAAAARVLLERGADPNASDDSGRDVLRVILEGGACVSGLCGPGRFDVADALVDWHGPRTVRAPFNPGRLDHAAFSHNIGAVRWLIRHGTPVRSESERSPLHAICWQGEYADPSTNTACQDIIDALIDAGADPDARDSHGSTPLHEAAHGDWGNPTAIRTLLRRGAKPEETDGEGRTPLMIAADNGELECVRLLVEAGADPSRQDANGSSAIDAAREHVATWRQICASRPDGPVIPGVEESEEDVAARHAAALEKGSQTLALLEAAAEAGRGRAAGHTAWPQRSAKNPDIGPA